MSTEQIAAIALAANPIREPSLAPLGSTASVAELRPTSTNANFGDMITQGLSQVNQQLMESQTGLQQLAVGNVQNLHQLMTQLEESKLSFQLVMQVRNRLLEAYQDVMKMQM